MDWIKFDFNNKESRPTKYGKYLVKKLNSDIYIETWNGSGWAYNHDKIEYWMYIESVIEILESNNKWRKGDDYVKKFSPSLIIKSTDIIIDYLKNKLK